MSQELSQELSRAPSQEPGKEPARRAALKRRWLRYGVLWLGLLALMGATLALAYVPLGPGNLVLHLAIAALQVSLLWLFFMDLRGASTLVRLTAACGFLWLAFMFALTFTDYLSRG
jgi:cytochrome c oxidase subunit 4